MDKKLESEIIAKFIAGDCSPEEYEEVRAWAEADPQNARLIKELQNTWNASGELKLEQDEDKAWQDLSGRLFQGVRSASIHKLNQSSSTPDEIPAKKDLNVGKSTSIGIWVFRAAAIILLAAGVSYLIYHYSSAPNSTRSVAEKPVQRVMREVAAERGQRVRVTFSDGTSVILNASSVIRFPEQFDNGIREVELNGEAYFRVVHKDDIPFIVHTDKADVQVLGTKFNVSAYPDDSSVEVVVAKGKVAVHSGRLSARKKEVNSDQKVILTRGQYTEVPEGKVPAVPHTVRLEPYLGWIKGRLVFESTPLKRVLQKLEHYYDQHFVVSDSSLYERQLTATFDRESFSKVLDVITLAMDMKYEQKSEADKVILSPDPSKSYRPPQ